MAVPAQKHLNAGRLRQPKCALLENVCPMKKAPYLVLFLILFCSLSFSVALWKKETNNRIAAFSSNEGVAYVGFADGTIWAVEMRNGALLWESSIDDAPFAMAADSNSAFVGTEKGKIYSLSAKKGALATVLNISTSSPASYLSSLTLVNPFLFASADGTYLVNTQSSKFRWAFKTGSQSSALGFSQSSVFFESGGNLYSLDASSGQVLWNVSFAPLFLSTPYYSNGVLYAGATDNSFHALDAATGQEIWVYDTGAWVESEPVIYGNSIYFGSNDHNLYSLDKDTGKLIWKFKVDEAIQSPAAVFRAKDRRLVAFTTNDGFLYVLDPSSGKQVLRTSTYGPSRLFTIYGDNILVLSDNGVIGLYSISTSCNVASPVQGELVNKAPVYLSGYAYSQSGISQVQVRINNGSWQSAAGTDRWFYSFDPTTIVAGQFNVECRVVDSQGVAETGHYSSTYYEKSFLASPAKMRILAEPWLVNKHGDAIRLSVLDERRKPIVGATVTAEGKTYITTARPIEFVPTTYNQIRVQASKDGYNDAEILVYNLSEQSPLPLVAGFVAVMAAYYYFFIRKRAGPAQQKPKGK